MFSFGFLILAFFFCITFVYTLKLPSYTLACSRNDPNLNDCVVKHGQMAIPYFINGNEEQILNRLIVLNDVKSSGDPRYKVPRLDPLFITELTVRQGIRQVGIALTLRNSSIYGLKNSVFKEARTNLPGRHIEWDFEIPKLHIIGDYEVGGQILILPIVGSGKANVTITDLKITYKYDWDYVTKKNGKQYMNITKGSLDYENGRTYFQLENLFNGDKLLGDNMLVFLNENWKDVTREIGPAVGEAIAEVFRLILTSIADLVPWEYIYPDI